MSRRFAWIAGISVALLALWTSVRAAGPTFWQVATRADFLKGEVESLSVDSDGRLRLGAALDLLHDTGAPFLWAAVIGRQGALYVGSGSEGKVFRLDPAGKASVWFDAEEPEVHALAIAPDGAIYVGTSPNGKIYRVDAGGSFRVFFDPDDRYIWALGVDAQGVVYAGTGEKGTIYRITPDGKGAVFYKAAAKNIVTIVADPQGGVLAGTDSPGRVLRVDGDGKPTILLDTGYREARVARVDGSGNILVVALDGVKAGAEAAAAEAAEPPKSVGVPSVSTDIMAITILDVGAAASADVKPAATPATPRTAKGAVFRILPDGMWDLLWESPDDVPFDLSVEASGSLLVATGSRGRLYRIEGDPPRVSLVGRVTAEQVTHVVDGDVGRRFCITANPGKVFRVAADRATTGTYESDVRDTETVSTWGVISWRASSPQGSRVDLYTRSGNTSRPDDTWSAWTGPYRAPDGDQIRSPKARYLQWKAVLTGSGDGPVLTSVTAAYLQRNLRPRVTSITVHPPGLVFQKPYSTGEPEIAGFEDTTGDGRPVGAAAVLAPAPVVSALSRRLYQKGLQAFQWKAEDPNDDRMRYDVLYRAEAETSWRPLKRDLADPVFVWDTATVPNGSYIVRVVATDAPSNPSGATLTGDMDSVAFEIDNAPPSIRVTAARRDADTTVLAFEAVDVDSPVVRADYSVDSGAWQRLYPTDLVADSKRESFELRVRADLAAHTIVLRAIDALNNVATIKVEPPAR